MNDKPDLDALLAAEPVDAGCAASFEVLHRYVEEELAGGQPAATQPGMAAHLVSCPACRQDHAGLLDAASLFGEAGPPTG